MTPVTMPVTFMVPAYSSCYVGMYILPYMATRMWSEQDLRAAFAEYAEKINASGRKPNTKATYLTHADRFVRWLLGEVTV